MSAVLERYAAELKKLSVEELNELSAWIADYQRTLKDEATSTGTEVAWPDFDARARLLFPDGPPEPSFLDTLLDARSSRF